MISFGSCNIDLDDVVNEAFAEFSFDQDDKVGVERLFSMLIGYGLVELGYLNLQDLPWEENE